LNRRAVQRCTIPETKARAGKTSIVHALEAEELELRAETRLPTCLPPST
jgi:hypothetical protein